MIESLDPSAGFLIIIDLMFGTASFPLCFPVLEEAFIVEDVAVDLRPFAESLTTGTVHRTEASQLPELLRELRDFR
jgi:hypothetical protein